VETVVVMAGGLGTRLGGVRKPLMSICGRRLVDVAVSAAREAAPCAKVLICARHGDRELLGDVGAEVLECPGRGYVEDLAYALARARLPALVLPADMPFLSPSVLRLFLEEAARIGEDVVTLVACGSSCRVTGISLFRSVGGSWRDVVLVDSPELRDVDTVEDLKWALDACESTGERGGLGLTSARI